MEIAKEIKVHPRVGVGVAVLREGHVLLGKRKGAHAAGLWGFPGGHLEFGETPHECVKRELEEEAGLIPLKIISGPWSNDIIENEKHYVTLMMFVTEFEGIPQLREPHKCESWQWHPWDDMPTPLFVPIIRLIEKFGIERLKKHQLE